MASFQPNIGGGLTFHTQLLLRVRYCNAWQTVMQNIHIIGQCSLQTVTIAVMLVDCTKLVYPICHLSSNVIWLKQKWHTIYASTEKISLPFELTDGAKLLHFTILGGGPQTLQPPPPKWRHWLSWQSTGRPVNASSELYNNTIFGLWIYETFRYEDNSRQWKF